MYFPRDAFEKEAIEGRKSKDFIEATLAYVDKLNSMRLPVIFSLKHLSLTLDLPYQKIWNMTNQPNRYYKTFNVKKKSGGIREIKSPKQELKMIQRWIYENILKQLKTYDKSCMGFIEGISIREVAEIHKNQELILKLDLCDFFENITQKQVYHIFKDIGYTKNVSMDLAKLTTVSSNCEDEGKKFYLPQGAPTSPALSNLVARNLDKRLRLLSEKLGVNYSRYADDLTFSGDKNSFPRLSLINQIVEEEGFSINNDKTAFQKKGNKQIVLGLNVSNGVLVPKKYKKEIWTHLHYCKMFGPIKHLSNIKQQNKSSYKDWLYGRICYVKSIEPEVGKKMIKKFNEISWPF